MIVNHIKDFKWVAQVHPDNWALSTQEFLTLTLMLLMPLMLQWMVRVQLQPINNQSVLVCHMLKVELAKIALTICIVTHQALISLINSIKHQVLVIYRIIKHVMVTVGEKILQ